MGIVDKIKALCKENGITMKTLEQNTKMSNGAIGKWDKSIPNAAALQRIADYFGVSVDYLLGRTDNPALSEVDTAKPSERAQAEAEFLAAFEKLTDKQKAIALGYMERMAEENNQKGES